MEVGSALPITSTGFYIEPHIKCEKNTHLENSETATTALWWWTWTEVGDESWFLETSWETPEYSGDTSRNLWTWFKLPARSFSLLAFIANIFSHRFKLSPDLKYVMLAFRPQRLFRWLSSLLHFVFLSILNVFFQRRSVFHARLCTLIWSFPLSDTPSSPSTTSTTSPPAGWSIELSRQRFFVNTWFCRSNSANLHFAGGSSSSPTWTSWSSSWAALLLLHFPGDRWSHISIWKREKSEWIEYLSRSGSPPTPCGIRNVGTKGQLHCLCLWRKYLLQVWKKNKVSLFCK